MTSVTHVAALFGCFFLHRPTAAQFDCLLLSGGPTSLLPSLQDPSVNSSLASIHIIQNQNERLGEPTGATVARTTTSHYATGSAGSQPASHGRNDAENGFDLL